MQVLVLRFLVALGAGGEWAVAAALVGTFLGILLCYGLVGPIAANMAKISDDEHAYLQVLRVVIVAFLKGTAGISTRSTSSPLAASSALPRSYRPSTTRNST